MPAFIGPFVWAEQKSWSVIFHFMSAFSVYIDASGKEGDSQWCVVAGFSSTVQKWELFESQWNDLLSDYKIPYLQMSLLHANKGHFAEQRWQDKDYVKDFLVRASGVIRSNVEHWSVQCVRFADFERVTNRNPGLRILANPYGHCASAVATILQVDCMMQEIPFMPNVEHFVEAGDEGVGFIQATFRRMGLPEPIARPGKPQEKRPNLRYYVHFQAADWLAFESRQFLKPNKQKIRPSHRALLYGLHGAARRWSAFDLENFCLKKLSRGEMV